LYPPTDGTLSSDDVVFNTIVAVACNTGFRHSGRELVKFLRCTDSQTWNDTFTDCQGMLCVMVSGWATFEMHAIVVGLRSAYMAVDCCYRFLLHFKVGRGQIDVEGKEWGWVLGDGQ